jgi:hypothetical protein
MTDPYSAYPETPVYSPEINSPDDTAGAVDTAKEQTGAVAQSAAHAGQQVASTTKDQVQNVAAEAGTQAKDLLAQARTEVTEQAGTQQQRLATGLRSLADELGTMARNSNQSGMATDLARQASEHTQQIASWFDSREPGHVLDEVKTFARQRPGTFLAIAAITGLVVGRLTRGVKDASSDDSAPSASTDTSPDSSRDSAPLASAPLASAPRTQNSGVPFASSQDGPGGYPVVGGLQ